MDHANQRQRPISLAGVSAPWWTWPMNSQSGRIEMVREVIARCRIKRFIETGAFFGTTTEFFASYNLPVTTIENNPEYATRAVERLKARFNVDVRVGDSVEVLRDITQAPINRAVPALFYLDAHWESHLPLRQEIELVLGSFAKPVIIVDDFKVPDDEGYGFDDYGPGKRLDLEYLGLDTLPPVSIYFPALRSAQESGARRGCVVITSNAKMAGILDEIPRLRRWQQ